MSSTGTYDSFNMGRVASRTFGAIGRNFITFFILAAIAVIPQQVLTTYLGVGRLARPGLVQPQDLPHVWGLWAIAMLAGIVFTSILQAALVHGTVADLNGKKASLGDCLQTGLSNCLPVIGLSLLFGLVLGLGFVLLIVPGVIIGLAWIVAVPALVVEKTGIFGAFGRSAELTKGHRWVILALVVVTYIILLLLGLLLMPLQFSMLTATDFTAKLPFLALSVVISIISSTIVTAGIASLYYELRAIKEGIAPEQLAAVFD